MKALILLLTLAVQTQPCLKSDIIIVADMSTSVYGYEGFIANAGLAFVDRFELSEEGIRIGVIAFAGTAWYIARLTDDKAHLAEQVEAIRRMAPGGTTTLASALSLSLDEFMENGRPDFQKVIVLISDGDAQDKETALIMSRQLRQAGVNIFGVLVGSEDEKPEFMQAVCDVYVASNYGLLADEFRRLDVCF